MKLENLDLTENKQQKKDRNKFDKLKSRDNHTREIDKFE
jgi:hypothetical protein